MFGSNTKCISSQGVLRLWRIVIGLLIAVSLAIMYWGSVAVLDSETSGKELLLEAPVYYKDAFSFATIYDGRQLNVGDGLLDISQINSQDGIVIWKGRRGDRKSILEYGIYEATSQRRIYAASQEALISSAVQELGLDVKALFPLTSVDKYIEENSSQHMLFFPWDYDKMRKGFNLALRQSLSGDTNNPEDIKDARGYTIQCEISEDGKYAVLSSAAPDGTRMISLKVQLESAY